MTSIIKVQNIQYTDGDAALTIADGGIVTGHNTLNVSHGTTGNSVGTFINTTGNSNTNGVVHVKQSAGTNQPTMVIEQTGGGGNPSDTQGLHIKIAGQNQGTGKAIRVTTTNSSLNSGNAYDPFTVTNGGEVYVKNTSNAATLSLNQAGQLIKPLQPRMSNYKYTSQTIPHNTLTPIQYNGTNWTNNIQGIASSNTHSRYTVPVAGWYLLHGTLYWGNAVVTGAMITVHVNGSYKAYTYNQSMPIYTHLQVTHGLYLQANDYFEFMAYQYNGSNLGTAYDTSGEGAMFATAYLLG